MKNTVIKQDWWDVSPVTAIAVIFLSKISVCGVADQLVRPTTGDPLHNLDRGGRQTGVQPQGRTGHFEAYKKQGSAKRGLGGGLGH